MKASDSVSPELTGAEATATLVGFAIVNLGLFPLNVQSSGIVPVTVLLTEFVDDGETIESGPTERDVRYRFGALDAVESGGGARPIHEGHNIKQGTLVLHFPVEDIGFDGMKLLANSSGNAMNPANTAMREQMKIPMTDTNHNSICSSLNDSIDSTAFRSILDLSSVNLLL